MDTTYLCVGLRFLGRDALQLRELARRAAARDLKLAAGLFDQAADAATNNEPMLFFCKDEQEALAYVHDFPRWGITRPVIEQLSGAA